MQVTVLAVQTVQAVPTVTLLDMLHVQALWLWNHSAIVAGVVTGAWKLSRSIKNLPERITAPLSVRMDAHEKLDDKREAEVKTALTEARQVTDEHLGAMRVSIEQINMTLGRIMGGHSFGD